MSGRTSSAALIGSAAIALAASSGTRAVVPPEPPVCVFPIGITPTGDEEGSHVITYRKNVSCEGARSILRGLRGKRTLIPMACHGERILGGWHMRNMYLEWDGVQTHFARGNVQINYTRWGNSSVACNRVPPFESDEPDA